MIQTLHGEVEVEADNIITAVEDMAQDMVQDMVMVVEAEDIMEESE